MVQVYTYDWSNGATTEDLSNIGAGTYTVIVTDENGCFEEITVEITEPEGMELLKLILITMVMVCLVMELLTVPLM